MKKLRAIHLYLGCIFAPMLIFFATSGLWQTLGLHYSNHPILTKLSTLHTGRGLKNGFDLASPYMRVLVIAMAISLILTIILGVIMAFKFGHKRAALYSLAIGIAVPLIFVLMTLHR